VNSAQRAERYGGVAVGLHWLIAALIIGMLAVGKWMTSLETDDHLRFTLTQWHKSFGITVLLLSLFRLYWRANHKPPKPSSLSPAWELKAASITHIALYALLIIVPLTGWSLVSTSPLKIPTLLYNTIPWPHIPLLSPSDRGQRLFLNLHFFASNLMLALLLLHVAAAFRHHFIKKDGTLSRMSFFSKTGQLAKGFIPFVLTILVLTSGLIVLVNLYKPSTISTTIGIGEVRFTAIVMGHDLVGQFGTTEVEARIDPNELDNSLLSATVLTNTLESSDAQVNDTLKDRDWFDTEHFPEAYFSSHTLSKDSDGKIIVTGNLTIKDTTQEISFPVMFGEANGTETVSGSFTINRLDYQIGAIDQPDDSNAGFNVLISFSFEL